MKSESAFLYSEHQRLDLKLCRGVFCFCFGVQSIGGLSATAVARGRVAGRTSSVPECSAEAANIIPCIPLPRATPSHTKPVPIRDTLLSCRPRAFFVLFGTIILVKQGPDLFFFSGFDVRRTFMMRYRAATVRYRPFFGALTSPWTREAPSLPSIRRLLSCCVLSSTTSLLSTCQTPWETDSNHLFPPR